MGTSPIWKQMFDAVERRAGPALDELANNEYILYAAAAAMRTSGAGEINVFGYCFGGVLSLIFAAGHPETPLRSLSVMATPIDFGVMPGMNSMIRDCKIDATT